MGEERKTKITKQTPAGKQLKEEMFSGIRDIDPVLYETLMAEIATIPTGSCAECPDCQAGVKINDVKELEEMVRRRKGME
jgi:hypothetical protein